ncbi:hypothetical protein DPMN_016000 [Dreissena polymorpha]|uniref:Uncharacterized protein n=1 Tax=Dreissena polymorpha TaxID=45954 RepID=A0A9D4NA98_DREPO|nr:hypothetical protein DPMN_016000 [Dreissena polymorpha]
MKRSKKLQVPVSGNSSITNFFVRTNNESCDLESPHPPTKRFKQRASGFDSSWK